VVEVICTSETFRAACRPGQVVIIRRALYGRLTAGRCITSEYAHALGCYADVTAHVQDACSGSAWRQNCSLLVATVDAIAQPCGKDFKSYLDIEHHCVAGTNTRCLFRRHTMIPHGCQHHAKFPHEPFKYIPSNSVTVSYLIYIIASLMFKGDNLLKHFYQRTFTVTNDKI